METEQAIRDEVQEITDTVQRALETKGWTVNLVNQRPTGAEGDLARETRFFGIEPKKAPGGPGYSLTIGVTE